MGNSLGLIRVIGSVTPFAALTALIGFNYLISKIHIKYRIASYIIAAILLIWIVQGGITTNINGFKISRPKQLVGQAADFLHENKLDKHKIFYYNSYLIIKLGLDPFDESKSRVGVSNRLQPALSMPDSSILMWDAHFGPNEGRLPLSRLKNSEELTLLRVIRPTQPFKVLGGYDYAIYIFQKIPKTNEGTAANSSLSLKQFVFDFEDIATANDSMSYSGNKSFQISPDKEYFAFLDYQIQESTNSVISLKIDFSAVILCEEKKKNDEIILVCNFKNSNGVSDYQAFNLKNLIESNIEWSKIQHTFKIYDLISAKGSLKLYLWNKSRTTFNIDEVKIEVTTFDSQKEYSKTQKLDL